MLSSVYQYINIVITTCDTISSIVDGCIYLGATMHIGVSASICIYIYIYVGASVSEWVCMGIGIMYGCVCASWLVGWVLWHINLCRLFNAKFIFIQIDCSISNNSLA